MKRFEVFSPEPGGFSREYRADTAEQALEMHKSHTNAHPDDPGLAKLQVMELTAELEALMDDIMSPANYGPRRNWRTTKEL